MQKQVLHIFRNTPFGREILLQSIYFCKKTDSLLRIYIPRHKQFLMYFENEIATIDLDRSFLYDPKTARRHAEQILEREGIRPSFLRIRRFTASNLPDVPIYFDYMTCPRSISDLSSRIGLGHIGPKVRSIIKNARFPVIIPSAVFKPWNSITVFFGGSSCALQAIQTGMEIAKRTGFKLSIFTQAEKKSKEYYEEMIRKNPATGDALDICTDWLFFEKGSFEKNLWEVDHKSLVVVGAYGHGRIRQILFGSKMEKIQTRLPNNLLIVGPEVGQGPGI